MITYTHQKCPVLSIDRLNQWCEFWGRDYLTDQWKTNVWNLTENTATNRVLKGRRIFVLRSMRFCQMTKIRSVVKCKIFSHFILHPLMHQ